MERDLESEGIGLKVIYLVSGRFGVKRLGYLSLSLVFLFLLKDFELGIVLFVE